MEELRGQYTEKGIAEDNLAVLESLFRYQDAINLFCEGVPVLRVPDSPIRASVVGLAGSFAREMGRLGAYRSLSFDAVDEMLTDGMISFFDDIGYVGTHWTGDSEEILSHPSGLDMLIEFHAERATSLEEGGRFNGEIKELSRNIFERTGVYIRAKKKGETDYALERMLYIDAEENFGRFIPIGEIVGEGFVQLRQTDKTQLADS